MAQNVKLPNGQIVSFPDDATPAEIDGALNTYYPQFAPKEHPYDALQRVVDTAISNTIPTETLPEVPRQPEAEAEAAAREDRIRRRREAEGIDKLGTFGRYTHSFASGAGLATGTGINYIGRRFGIQSLEEFGNQIQDVAAARTPADQTFGEQVVSGIGSVASALATAAPISIAAESAPVLAGIAGIATFAPRIAKGLQIVSQWAPSAFAGAFEAAGNATQTYDDVLKKTGNKDLALHQADKTFLLNLPVNAALDKIGIFNKEGGVASRIIRAKLAEGTQEGVQQAISNYFAGNPVGEQFTQNAVVGGVVGGLAKAGHIAVERLAGKDDDDSATPPPDINNATNVDEAIAAANASLQTTVGDELTPAIDAFKADWEARMRDAAPPPMIGMEEPAHQSIVMPERAAPQDIFAPDRPLSKPLLELAELLRGMNVEEQTRGLMRLDPLMRRDVSNVMRALDDTEPAGLIVPGAGIQPGQGEASRITNESTLAASSVQPAAAMPAATTGVPALTERAAREIISKTPGMEMRPHRDVANRFEVVPAVSTAGEARGVFSTQPVPVAQQQLADQEAPAVAAAPAPTVVPTVAPALTLEQQQSNQAALDAERSSQPRRMFGEHSRLRSESGPDIKGERVTRPMRKFLAQLGRLTGTKIVFEYAPNESDGVVPVHGENTIHINTAATINPLSVMGHEVTHVLKDKHREAWQAIRTALSDTLGTGEERRAALMRFADDYWFAHPDRLEAISRREDFSTPLTDEEKRAFGTSENTIEDFLLDELTSDLGGAHWSSEKFWTDTFAKIEKQHGDKARGIIERLVSAIKESLNKFMMLVRQHQQAPYTTVSAEQIEKTRDAVTSAYAKFINEERRNEPEHVEDVGVRDTEAEHAYHSNPTGEQQGVELDAARRAELGEIEPVESRNRDAETRMFFEVAPNPNNLPLKRAWDRLSDKQQRSISEEIKQRVIPGLLKSLGIRATIQGQLGGWMNDTNPSFALVVKGGDIAMAARAITHVLDQESVYTLGLKPFTGAQKSGIIRIEVGDRSRAQIHQLYMAVRRIEPKVILGHSTINGEMLIGLPIETMQAIESKVIDTLQQFNVEGVDFIQGYSSNVTESDYESWLYGSPGERSEARDIDRWQADARRLFAGRSDGTGRPGLGSSLTEEARRSERRDGAVSAVGIHYSQAKRDYLASSAFGTGLKGAENERIAQSGDPRLKHRIYFYVNPGRAIRPEVGVGAHAHRAELTGLYDLQADSRNLALGRDANEFESALLDAGYNGYISHDRGVAVMLGPRSMRVDYMGLNNNPDVPVAERDVPSAYKAKQSAIMSNRILPSGQLTGAEWKAIVPAVVPNVDVSHLDDSRMYYRDQIVKRPVESQPRASEPRPVPKWYRSALADEAAAVTAKSMPVSGWQGWIKGLRANGKVKPDEITWSGIEDFIAAYGDARITADAVRAYLSEFGVKVQTLLRGESNPRTYDADVQVEEDEDEREYLEPDFHWGSPETEEPDEDWLYDTARDRYDEAVERMVDDEWDSTADVMRGYISHWSSFEKEAREQLGTLFDPSRDQVIAAAEALAIKDAAQESFEYYKTDNDPDDISEQELVERAVRILSDDDLVEKEARRRVKAGINEDELMSDLVDQEREWYYQDSESPFTQTITVTVGDNEYEFTYHDGWGEKRVWDDDNRREVYLGQNSYRLDEAGIQNAIWMHLIDEIGIDTHGAAVQRDTSGFIPTKWDSWATERYSAVAGSYREMQLLLPQGAVGDLTNRKHEGVTYTVYDKDGNAQIETAIGEDRAKERAEEIGGRYEKNNYPVPITERNDAPDFYYTTHFPEANILGFFRFDERIDQDGKRVMFIQEIQSDWGSFWYKAQKAEKNLPAMRERMAEMNAAIDTARQKLKHALDNTSGTDLLRLERKDVGLSESAPVAAVDALAELHALLDDRGVREKLQRDINDAEYDISRKPVIGPFTDATPKWTALVVKRIIAHAVEYGFDRVAWTTGAQQVERWQGGLRQQIDRIEWDKTEKGVHIVALKNGKVRQSTRYAETELTDAIGKLMSDRIFNDPNQSGVIEGDGITIDDVGMAASYDRIIPNTVNDLLRRLDKTIKVREIQVGVPIAKQIPTRVAGRDTDTDDEVWKGATSTWGTREAAEADIEQAYAELQAKTIGNQLGFDISDKLRETAERGMPLFSERRRRESQRAEQKADNRRAWYYSQLGAAVNDIPAKIKTGREAALWLQANAAKLGIKKDELNWSGVLDYLQSQPTPAGVSDWLRDNGVKVRDVVYSDEADGWSFTGASHGRPIFNRDNLVLPGGKNYRELLLTLPHTDMGTLAAQRRALQRQMDELRNGRLPENMSADENVKLAAMLAEYDSLVYKQPFTSSHFNQPNILAHLRFNECTDADGKRVLFIEEIQSDWAQTGRKERNEIVAAKAKELGITVKAASKLVPLSEGFGIAPRYSVIDKNGHVRGDFKSREEADAYRKNPPSGMRGVVKEDSEIKQTATAGIPSAPFVTDTKSWTSLALKRAIAYAVDNGFDKVAWTTGEQQNERYDLSKQVESINYDPVDEWLTAYPKNSSRDNISQSAKLSELPDIIGKEAAKKIEQAIESAEYDRRQWSIEEDEGKFVVIDPNGELRYTFGGDLETFDTYADAEEWIDANYNDGQTGVTISGLDLKVGGEGMVAFYDEIVPQIARKLGATMQTVRIATRETLSVNERYTYSTLTKLSAKKGEQHFVVKEGTNEQVAGPFKTWNEAHDWLLAHDPALATKQPGFEITDAMRKQVRVTGMPLFSQRRRSDNVTSLITRPVRDFHKSLRASMQDRAEEIQRKVDEHDGWKWDAGDRVKSFKTGGVYLITGRTWNDRHGAMYRYETADKDRAGDWQSGTLVADKAHETMERMGGPRRSEQRRPSPELEAWAGDTVVRNPDGSLRVMYHGTARDISTFRPKQANAIFLTDDPVFAGAFASMSHGWLMRNLDKWMTPDQIAAAQVAARSAAKADLKTGLKLDNALRDIENLAATNPYLNKAVEPYLPSGANIMPLYVRAENPFDYRNPEHVAALERELGQSWMGQEFINGEMFDVAQHIGDLERGDWNAIESPQVQAYIRKHHDSFYVREQGKTNLAVFSPNQVKSASGNQGTYSREDNDIRRSEMRRVDTNSPEFKRWFGDSKVVDAEGKPLVVYHSTVAAGKTDRFKRRMNDIGIHFGTTGQAEDRFDLKIGADPYGPDLRAVEHATIPVYLSIKNPLRLGDIGSFDSENLAYELVSRGVMSQQQADSVRRNHGNEGGRTAALRRFIEGSGYDGIVYRNEGETLGGESHRRARREAWPALAESQRRRGKPLNAFDAEDRATPEYQAWSKADTEYRLFRANNAEDSYIAFYPTQIKSAISNTGEFSTDNPDIRRSERRFQPSGHGQYLTELKNQVKSASGNQGTYSREDNDIRRSEMRPVDTESPAFRKWFKDSKAVDDNGKPLRVYHATRVGMRRGGMLGDVNAFDRMATVNIVKRAHSIDTLGSWFSNNPGERGAGMYANAPFGTPDGEMMYATYLSIQNPWRTTFDAMIRVARRLGGVKDNEMLGKEAVDALRYWLHETGRDGVHIIGSKTSSEFDGQEAWIALEPTQIKSAISNTGEFSADNPDIRRSERRFQPSGHGQYLTELKNAARDLDSNNRRTQEFAQARAIKVMDMPAVLRQIVDGTRGKVFRNIPQRIVGSGSTLLVKPMDQHMQSKHGRAVDPKVIFNLPNYLADPLAVFSGESGQNASSFRVVVRDRFNGSNPVVALEPKAANGFVLTIHPSDDKQLQRWIDGGLLHYVDEKAAGLRPAATDGSVGGSIPRIPNVDWSVAKERAESKGRVVVTRDQVADMDEARLSAPRGAIAGQPINQSWQAPDMTDWDNFVRKMQDKQVDTKRVLQAIRDAGNTIDEKFDVYLQETLYHGRTATRVHNFVDGELRQLLEDMHRRNIGMQELDDYLWARHAVERNAQIAKVNPSMPDGGSGLTNMQAADILSGQQVTVGTRDIKLDTTKMRGYAAIATKVDAITNGTLDLLVKYGLEKQQTVNQWRRTYQHYAPLMRDMEADSGFLGAFNLGLGTGQGFNVRGSASKRAMGSQRSVTDVLANVAMQRERAIVRGEKNRIAQALYGLAISTPNTDFWIPVNPDLNQRLNPASLQKLIGELTHIGVNPIDAMNIAKEPKQRYIDNNTGMVAERINPSLRGRDDVLSTRINGEERFVMFSTDQRAQMMVRSLKNLDADQLGGFTQAVAPVTRWFASINTQFNPIFGLTNGIRDIGTGMLNLSSTPLSGHRADILRNTFSALKGVYLDLRDHRAGRQPTSQWAQLFEQFALDGGQTGYRDMFATSEDRANEIAKELKAAGNGQSWFAVGEKHSKVLGWLSDYNTAVENAVRLSAYKVALDNGRSRQDAARIAKELTVNFNRKGLAATQTGALYAFFNAAVQGTARIAETMIKNGKLTPAGQRIMYGGMLLGVMQAVMGALAGWDDNEPPQFVREKNLIIPIVGTDKYVSIPMPLGFHILPNIGRISAEFALSGFRNPSKRLLSLANVILDGFNPIGSGTLAQTLSPTIADPIVALSENKDWTGKSIYKEDFNKMHPTPGWTRTKDTASDLSKWLAYGVNYLTGGGKYEIGAVSPTPDQIDYLISQATGGVGREGLKVWQTGKAEATGEDVPMYKVPVAGRFVGETKGQASEIAKFYDSLKRIGEHKSAIDEMKQAHDSAALQAYYADHPDARFVQLADRAQREIGYLRRQKSDMIEKGVSRERIKLMEDRITAKVQGFNQMLTEKRE